MGEYDKAITVFRRALEVCGENDEIKESLEDAMLLQRIKPDGTE